MLILRIYSVYMWSNSPVVLQTGCPQLGELLGNYEGRFHSPAYHYLVHQLISPPAQAPLIHMPQNLQCHFHFGNYSTYMFVVFSWTLIFFSWSLFLDSPFHFLSFSAVGRYGSFAIPIDINVNLAPRPSLVVYTVYNELVADSTFLQVEKCFRNKVSKVCFCPHVCA